MWHLRWYKNYCKNSRIIRLFGFESIKKKCLLFLFYSLSCPSSGHSWTKRWASTEQATGTHGPSLGHRQNKRRALIARAVCTECPNVGQFLGTSYRSAALPLCMMPHDYLVVIEWRFLWYFYDTSMILLVRKSKMYHSSISLCISYLSLYSAIKMILWYFLHKKLYRPYGWNSLREIALRISTSWTNHTCRKDFNPNIITKS